MGRTVYAEERLLDYLKPLGGSDAYSVGLILGQSTAQKDFVVHLARTLPASNTDVVEEALINPATNALQDTTDNYIKSIKDIDGNLVADHAKHVSRMLPGGMWVLGIFVVGPGDCLSDSSCAQKLRSVLSAIHKNLASNIYLHGNSNHENLVLSFNSITKQYTCKSVEISTGGIFKPADWKFQKKITKWHQLEALFDLDHLFPILDEAAPHTLKRQLQDIVKKLSEIISSALIVIEGESRSPEDLIEVIGKKRKNKKDKNEDEEVDKVLQVGIYLPCGLKDKQEDVKTISCRASMRLVGELVSRTSIHQKATIEEATNAVKQDILRSLASRLELHWDSVIEEENGSPEENITLHEPPRRVFVELPQSKVTLSDYLFPGEGPQESLVLLKELLDLDFLESQVEKDVERQVDPSEFYCQNEVKTVPVDLGKETVTNSQFVLYIAGIIIAFIVVIIGILVHQLYSSKQ
ncbi:hypothetical protein TSAR_005674 [Trichomalopsis sarcophagae]|uniref:Protein odr-4 homolog n=1 Tax=Trichomalopsis sarcophagae TaxID=543379 RepID=A0A232ET99_9HYME|nr:hypothetical protein TSAR_005674 [Trichomalopsis sarcophagae]